MLGQPDNVINGQDTSLAIQKDLADQPLDPSPQLLISDDGRVRCYVVCFTRIPKPTGEVKPHAQREMARLVL